MIEIKTDENAFGALYQDWTDGVSCAYFSRATWRNFGGPSLPSSHDLIVTVRTHSFITTTDRRSNASSNGYAQICYCNVFLIN